MNGSTTNFLEKQEITRHRMSHADDLACSGHAVGVTPRRQPPCDQLPCDHESQTGTQLQNNKA